jgi:hypothetical protein
MNLPYLPIDLLVNDLLNDFDDDPLSSPRDDGEIPYRLIAI